MIDRLEEQFFYKHHRTVPIVEKQDYTGFVNLSSNQLEHSEYHKLFKQFIAGFRCDAAREYAYLKPVIEKIAAYNKVNANCLLLSAGSDVAIYCIIDLIGSNSKKIVIQSPTYRSYYEYAKLKRISVEEISYLDKDQGQFTAELVDYCLRSDPGLLVVITNPNNFTGESISLDNLKKIIDVCSQKNHMVLIDESYIDFHNEDHSSFIACNNHVVFVKTLSKSYGMAGLRLAITYSTNPEIIDYLKRTGVEKSTSILSAKFYEYLLDNQQAIDNLIQDLQMAKHSFVKTISQACSDFFIYPSSTNFITIDVKTVDTAREITNKLRKNKFLIKHLHDGKDFTSLIRVTASELKNLLRVSDLIVSTWGK